MAALVEKAERALRTAQAFADTHDIGFSFRPAYAMGGRYEGADDSHDGYIKHGWNASSASC